MKKTTLLLSIASMLAINIAKAQDTAQTPAEKEKTEVAPKAGGFSFTGYIDQYYFYNTNNPLDHNNLGQSNARCFDQRANTFGLGLVQTKIGYSHKKSDVVMDLVWGPNADMGNYGNSPFLSLSPQLVSTSSSTTSGASATAPLVNGGGSILTAVGIKQAYWNFKATDKLTITAGQFGTHIGYEVIDATLNFNYSLSNLFNNGPFYHIGVKGNYAFSDKFAIMAGIVNNIDALYSNNNAKGGIAQVFISPKAGWNIYVNYIGNNAANSNPITGINSKGFYQLLDLTSTFQISTKFFCGLNAAIGSQTGTYQSDPSLNGYLNTNTKGNDTTRTWGGVALYPQYAFTEHFTLGARVEWYDNDAGVRFLRNYREASYQTTGDANSNSNVGTGAGTFGALGGNNTLANPGTHVFSYTLTGSFKLDEGHLTIKPEIRFDQYKKQSYTGAASGDVQQFQDSSGNWTKNTQCTIGAAAIYSF